MSRSGDVNRKTQKPFSGERVQSLSDRFHSAVNTFEGDKPDKIGFGLSSPVSPLRTNRVISSSTAVTNTSSSSSSSGSAGRATQSNAVVRSSSHSGELSGSSGSSPTAVDSARSREPRASKSGHSRSGSAPLIYSGGIVGGGGSSVSSPPTNVLPAGNICPSGKVGTTGMMCRNNGRTDVLGRGGNYGHGSIIRGSPSGGVGKSGVDMPPMGKFDSSSALRRAMVSMNLEEVKRVGNEQYKRGQFTEALKLYDRAIAICQDNAACRSNRAAALMAMGRLGEAVRECEEAVRLDPTYERAHQRLASLYLRLGQVENAATHFHFTGQLPDPMELQKLQAVERHLSRCADVWMSRDWKSLLRESDSAIASGADSSLLLIALKADALLRLHRLNEADSTLSNATQLEILAPNSLQILFLGMLSGSYLNVVRAQVDMAFGRFENAESAAERAHTLDPQNKEASRVLSIVKSVSRSRARGNELFTSGRYADACIAYGEGLRSDPFNPVLYCNRAVCYSKLEQWEKSIEDCNEALKIQPNYTKALLRRAASYGKLERWAESVHDYETLRKELPNDTSIAESLFHAEVALKASCGEEISNMKFGGEVEKVVGVEQFRSAISLPGVTVVHFMAASNQQCLRIAPFIDTLCSRNPSLNFLKVDVNENPVIAKSENVVIVPTIKIYKNGARMKEMICPSQHVLEYSVRHYGL